MQELISVPPAIEGRQLKYDEIEMTEYTPKIVEILLAQPLNPLVRLGFSTGLRTDRGPEARFALLSPLKQIIGETV